MTLEFHSLSEDCFAEVYRIEQAAHTHPWSENLLTQSGNKFTVNQVLRFEGKIVGYFYGQCVAGEASLLNLAVCPNMQGRGFGRQLLQQFLSQMQLKGATEAWLEVRESNHTAIRLYESVGFNEFDCRYDYYPTEDGHENALVMSYWYDT